MYWRLSILSTHNQLQLLQTHLLDGPDACVGQGRHESLQLASSEGGVPDQMPPHDNEVGAHHLGCVADPDDF